MKLDVETGGLSPPLFPFIAVISNAQAGLNEEWQQEASLKFAVSQSFLRPDEPFVLHVAGQPLLAQERKELTRNIRRCIARTRHPESAARLLARAVQRVALRNAAVGANVMCVPIRRSTAGVRISDELGLTIPVGENALNEIRVFQHAHHDLKPGLGIYLPAPGTPFAYFGPSYVDDKIQLAGMVVAPADQYDSIVTKMDRWTRGAALPKRGPVNRFTA